MWRVNATSRRLIRDGLPASKAPAEETAAAHDARCINASKTGGSDAQDRMHAAMSWAGWLGFVFFLVKGLVWLAVPYVLFLIGISNGPAAR
jgi:hypothetical protein